MFMSREVEKAVKTTVTLARDLWESAKIEAVKRGLTLAQVVEAALKKYLELTEAERKRRAEAEKAEKAERK
jgi:hypothetical protein